MPPVRNSFRFSLRFVWSSWLQGQCSCCLDFVADGVEQYTLQSPNPIASVYPTDQTPLG